MATRTQTPAERTAEMRRQLPDGPGVYLFKDRRGRVLYVGKASSIRKRVGSHFSKPATRGAYEMLEQIESIIRFLSGRYSQIERDLEAAMYEASEAQEFELAANLRNRLKAVQSLLERQRISNEAVGTIDVIAVAAEGTDANAQVFQV